MNSTTIGSILHGAYGDYYEQAVCLKAFRLSHPELRMKLFAASPHRLDELRVLDFSWADCFDLHSEIPKHRIDKVFQFQAHDRELRAEVFSTMPADLRSKLEAEPNRLPWHSLRSILPLRAEQQLGLSDVGRSKLPSVIQENAISRNVFQRPTIGFLWRHRAAGGAVKPAFQADAMRLVEKYSRLFRRLIDSYGCHVLICGMKVTRTSENMYRIDAKYPEYGLDLPANSATHLMGLNWALELEILSRCTLCVANPSGFSEALWIKRGGNVLLLDPPPHYLAKAVKHRVPLFNLHRPMSLISAVASRCEPIAYSTVSRALDRLLARASMSSIEAAQDIAS